MPPSSIIAARLTSQLLAGEPARDPVTVTGRLLAVQGQDARGARLAIRARSEGLSAGDVDRALTEERSLLITWLNRGTLHLVCSADYWWLHSLTTPPLMSGSARRLAQEGVSPTAARRGVRALTRALAREGPLTRLQLRERIAAEKVRTEGQALIHVLMLASLEGRIVRGPTIGREHAYVLVDDWLAPPPRISREQALAELARRYLAGHGPAADRDLARWSGLPLRDARAGLSAIATELQVGPGGLVRLKRSPAPAPTPEPKLLGPFDPLLLGWCSREEIVGKNRSLVTNNGIFRPFALVDGRAVARWRLVRGNVELEPFERLRRADAAALAADARAVLSYLSSTSASVKPS